MGIQTFIFLLSDVLPSLVYLSSSYLYPYLKCISGLLVYLSSSYLCPYLKCISGLLLYLSSSYLCPYLKCIFGLCTIHMYIILFTCLFVRINHSFSWNSSHGGHLPGFCLYVLRLASVCSYSCIVLTASCDNIQLSRVYSYTKSTFITFVSKDTCRFLNNVKYIHISHKHEIFVYKVLTLCAILCNKTKHP